MSVYFYLPYAYCRVWWKLYYFEFSNKSFWMLHSFLWERFCAFVQCHVAQGSSCCQPVTASTKSTGLWVHHIDIFIKPEINKHKQNILDSVWVFSPQWNLFYHLIKNWFKRTKFSYSIEIEKQNPVQKGFETDCSASATHCLVLWATFAGKCVGLLNSLLKRSS